MRDYTLSKEKIAELKLPHRSLHDKRQANRAKAAIAYNLVLKSKRLDSLCRFFVELLGSNGEIMFFKHVNGEYQT